MVLNNPDLYPDERVLNEALSENGLNFYNKLLKTITLKSGMGLTCEWHYYKDGKSWLCKVANKKRTIFWLSVWEGYFKVSFYFTEKHKQGICDLAISDVIKQQFLSAKPVGKLIPLTIDINSIKQLPDLIEIINLRIG